MTDYYPTGYYPFTNRRLSYFHWHDDPLRLGRAKLGYVYSHERRATEDLEAFLRYEQHRIDTGGTLHGVVALRPSNIRPLMRMAPIFDGFIKNKVGVPGSRGRKSKVVTHEQPVDLPRLVVVADGRTARLVNTTTGWTSEPFPRTMAIRLAAALNPTPTEGD